MIKRLAQRILYCILGILYVADLLLGESKTVYRLYNHLSRYVE